MYLSALILKTSFFNTSHFVSRHVFKNHVKSTTSKNIRNLKVEPHVTTLLGKDINRFCAATDYVKTDVTFLKLPI